jgi:hypothetical protein
MFLMANNLIDNNNNIGSGIYQFDIDAFVSLETSEIIKKELGPFDIMNTMYEGLASELREYCVNIQFRKEYTEDNIFLRFPTITDREDMIQNFREEIGKNIEANIFNKINKFYKK